MYLGGEKDKGRWSQWEGRTQIEQSPQKAEGKGDDGAIHKVHTHGAHGG